MFLFKKRKALCLFLSIYTLLSFPMCHSLAKGAPSSDTNEEAVSALSEDVKVGSRLIELFFGKNTEEKTVLIPGGEVFGIKLKQDHVSVVECGKIPALKRGDILTSINGRTVKNLEDVTTILNECKGGAMEIVAKRGDDQFKIEVRPSCEDGEYKLGISLRDSALGIGTVTFIDPNTKEFGGLGHGICDGDTGEIISMESGEVRSVILGGVHKGEAGKPGELTGILTEEDQGDLYKNSECGVFGIITGDLKTDSNAMPLGKKEDVHSGNATIISTVKNGKKSEYKIEISEVDKSSVGSKSFKIKVTDPTLKALTGGIVRGMSGSPIIQDGKLVGAVTHVMVADPTEGYGIFIENMLNVAEMPMAKAS